MVCLYLFLVLLILNLTHHFRCLQRSDWTYDSETKTAFFTTNGVTYSCPPWDIIGPIALRYFKTLTDPCLYGVMSVKDPSCVPVKEVMRNISALLAKRESPACDVLVPTTEETLERIETVYRSTSLGDNPATQDWYDQLLQDLKQWEDYCEKGRSTSLQTETINYIKQMALIAYESYSIYWLQLRDTVSESWVVLEEALKQGVDVRNISATFENEKRDREQIFALELTALQDTYENEMNTWHELAKQRTNFVRNLSRTMNVEDFVTAEAWEFVKIRTVMLTKMAQANEMLAHIEYIVRDIATNLELVCLSRDDERNQNLPFGVNYRRKNESPLALEGTIAFLIVILLLLEYLK